MGQHLIPQDNVRLHTRTIPTAEFGHPNFTLWEHSSPHNTELAWPDLCLFPEKKRHL